MSLFGLTQANLTVFDAIDSNNDRYVTKAEYKDYIENNIALTSNEKTQKKMLVD